MVLDELERGLVHVAPEQTYGLSGGAWCVLASEAVGARRALQNARTYYETGPAGRKLGVEAPPDVRVDRWKTYAVWRDSSTHVLDVLTSATRSDSVVDLDQQAPLANVVIGACLDTAALSNDFLVIRSPRAPQRTTVASAPPPVGVVESRPRDSRDPQPTLLPLSSLHMGRIGETADWPPIFLSRLEQAALTSTAFLGARDWATLQLDAAVDKLERDLVSVRLDDTPQTWLDQLEDFFKRGANLMLKQVTEALGSAGLRCSLLFQPPTQDSQHPQAQTESFPANGAVRGVAGDEDRPATAMHREVRLFDVGVRCNVPVTISQLCSPGTSLVIDASYDSGSIGDVFATFQVAREYWFGAGFTLEEQAYHKGQVLLRSVDAVDSDDSDSEAGPGTPTVTQPAPLAPLSVSWYGRAVKLSNLREDFRPYVRVFHARSHASQERTGRLLVVVQLGRLQADSGKLRPVEERLEGLSTLVEGKLNIPSRIRAYRREDFEIINTEVRAFYASVLQQLGVLPANHVPSPV